MLVWQGRCTAGLPDESVGKLTPTVGIKNGMVEGIVELGENRRPTRPDG